MQRGSERGGRGRQAEGGPKGASPRDRAAADNATPHIAATDVEGASERVRQGVGERDRMKRLRGSWLDPFGHTEERRLERSLAAQYETTIAQLLTRLDAGTHDLAVQMALLPDGIRGYDHVKRAGKRAGIESARKREAALMQELLAPAKRAPIAVLITA